MRRTHCGSCGWADLYPFLDLGSSPLADAFPAHPDDEERWHPLGLVVCPRCWLVGSTWVVPDAELYGDGYAFRSGTSPSLVAYMDGFAAWLRERVQPRLTVEIACNDGTLLRRLPGRVRIGVEPSGAAADADGLDVLRQPFGRETARDIRSASGHADLIAAANVVAHVSDLDDFLGGIAELLDPDGLAVIECQSIADLLTGNQFDHVYHEHRAFFGLDSLATALARHGLTIAEHVRTPAQGGSLRIVARHGAGMERHEPWLLRIDAYTGLQGRVEHIVARLRDMVAAEREQGRTVAGYAASAKSTTLLTVSGIDLPWVEDTSPTKIGLLTPGTHIPVVGPDHERPDTFLLLAWNYLAGVLRRERAFLDSGGRFIVPIPQPVLI